MFEEHEYYTAEDQRLEQTYYNTEKGIYISQIQTVNKLHHYVSDNNEKYRYEYEQSEKGKNLGYITTLHKFQENLAQRTVKEKSPHEPHTYNEEGEELIDKTLQISPYAEYENQNDTDYINKIHGKKRAPDHFFIANVLYLVIRNIVIR